MDNRFSFKKMHSNCQFLIIFTFFTLISLFIAGFYLNISQTMNYKAIYNCQKDKCFLTAYLLIEDAKKLNQSNELLINKEQIEYSLEFLEVEIINNQVVQKIMINISKQPFYNNQTIFFTFLINKQNIWQFFWQNLKGGDAIS